MSTTLNPHTASRFGGEHPSIYKIHLSKGSPVQILPNKVYCGQDAFQRYIRSISPDDKLGSKEIMVDTQKMQQFEITESISPITHYQFENDEFVETKDGFIITGDMEPLIIQNVKDVYDREEL